MSSFTRLSLFLLFIVAFFAFLRIVFHFRSKNAKALTDRFLREAGDLNPIQIKNIELSYCTTTGNKTSYSYKNSCDLYLFDSFLVIVRRSNFLFAMFYSPIIIAKDIKNTVHIFPYLEIKNIEKIVFRKSVKGVLDLHLSDFAYEHFLIDMSFKNLSPEQLEQLSGISTWVKS